MNKFLFNVTEGTAEAGVPVTVNLVILVVRLDLVPEKTDAVEVGEVLIEETEEEALEAGETGNLLREAAEDKTQFKLLLLCKI